MGVWKECLKNAEKLSKCAGPHVFNYAPADHIRTVVCVKCGGEISVNNAAWYQKGLEHGAAEELVQHD